MSTLGSCLIPGFGQRWTILLRVFMPDLILYDLTTSKESLTNFLVVATTFLVA